MSDDLAEQRRAEIQRLDNTVDRLREALKPFAELGRKLDDAPNLIGLLNESDWRNAVEAYGDEQNVKPSELLTDRTGYKP